MTTVSIYKITSSNAPGLVYYGSTKQSLNRRFSQHRSDYNRYLGGRMNFCSSFDIIRHGGAVIELVRTCDESERGEVEGQIITDNECVNERIPRG